MTIFSEPAHSDKSSRVLGSSVMNFIKVDLPDPGFPETQKTPLPVLSHLVINVAETEVLSSEL